MKLSKLNIRKISFNDIDVNVKIKTDKNVKVKS